SDVLKSDLLSIKPQLNGKITVAHDAASDNFQPIEKKADTPTHNRLTVGYVGSLYQGKGVELIVELARLVHDMDFQIVGGSDALLSEWRARTNDLSNIKFEGFKPHKEVADTIASFDIVL